MSTTHLNEHDANQGAQSSGEFLGMTGNSGWYLLGAGGATILMVIVLWGILGFSILLCLFVGLVLCLLSVSYVFALKNNKPDHYDTDFFESALVEAGVLQFRFGPRARRPLNPFMDDAMASGQLPAEEKRRNHRQTPAASRSRGAGSASPTRAQAPENAEAKAKPKASRPDEDPSATRVVIERLQEELASTEEMLQEAIAAGEED